MKKYAKSIPIILFGLLIMIPSCKDDTYIVPTVVITTPVSFANNIQPILNNSCAVSGCHVPGAQAPDLSTGNAYNNLFLYGLIDTTTPNASVVYLHLTANGYSLMPPVGSLSPSQIGTVLAWIKQGGQNN